MADNHLLATPIEHARTNVSKAFRAFSEVGDGVVSILDPQYGAGDCPRNHQSARVKEVDGKKFITKIAIKVQWA